VGSNPTLSFMESIMHDIEQYINTKDFNQLFWEWFDDLPESKRNIFNYYKNDVAKINFYNTQWQYRRHD